MAQISVRVSSHSDQENSITLIVGGRYVEYIIADSFPYLVSKIISCIEKGWTNYAVALATRHSREIYTINHQRRTPNWTEEKETVGTTDFSISPTAAYPYTVIAPKAQSITYRGARQWFKSEEDARAFAQSIYDGEPSKTFELCIVKCEDVVKPKPKTELISTWSAKQEG